VLDKIEEDVDSGYINASYISVSFLLVDLCYRCSFHCHLRTVTEFPNDSVISIGATSIFHINICTVTVGIKTRLLLLTGYDTCLRHSLYK